MFSSLFYLFLLYVVGLAGSLKLSTSCCPSVLNFVSRGSSTARMIISRRGNTACSNTVLLLPPNPLAQKKWKRQNICIPWVWWGNASQGDCSFPALTHRPFALSFCSRCWCATLGRGWCFWEGNSVSERRLARNRVRDLVQCLCAVGRHGETIVPGWFGGSSERWQGLKQYCLCAFLLLSTWEMEKTVEEHELSCLRLGVHGPSLLPNNCWTASLNLDGFYP